MYGSCSQQPSQVVLVCSVTLTCVQSCKHAVTTYHLTSLPARFLPFSLLLCHLLNAYFFTATGNEFDRFSSTWFMTAGMILNVFVLTIEQLL